MNWLWFVLGLAAGGLIVWLWMRARLARLEAAKQFAGQFRGPAQRNLPIAGGCRSRSNQSGVSRSRATPRNRPRANDWRFRPEADRDRRRGAAAERFARPPGNPRARAGARPGERIRQPGRAIAVAGPRDFHAFHRLAFAASPRPLGRSNAAARGRAGRHGEELRFSRAGNAGERRHPHPSRHDRPPSRRSVAGGGRQGSVDRVPGSRQRAADEPARRRVSSNVTASKWPSTSGNWPANNIGASSSPRRSWWCCSCRATISSAPLSKPIPI